jgi:acyl carrier protein
MQVQSSNSKLNEENAEINSVSAIQNWLVSKLAEQLSLDANTIDIAEPLTRYGLDSIDAVTMVGDLEDWLDLELPSTLFWDYPTIEKSSQYLDENYDLTEALGKVESSETATPAAKSEPAAAGKGWGGLFGKKK